MTIEGIKILGAVLELPAKQQCQSSTFTSKIGPKGLNWQCCLAGSSKTAPRILIFSSAMGADYSIELISIETYAPQFIGQNKIFLGSVHCYVPLCTTFKDPCCSAPVLGTKVVNVFDLKFSAQRWLFCRQKIVLLILHSSSC